MLDPWFDVLAKKNLDIHIYCTVLYCYCMEERDWVEGIQSVPKSLLSSKQASSFLGKRIFRIGIL